MFNETLKEKNNNQKNRLVYQARNLWSGILFGIGIVTFIDETVFHQILHWHHFYDKSTTGIGLVSDGLFHAFSWIATIGSLFMFADLRRRHAVWPARWWGGVLLGAGVFQLYDGTIQHKMLRLHQIRYNVNVFPYDLTWIVISIIIVAAGIIFIVRTRKRIHRQEDGSC